MGKMREVMRRLELRGRVSRPASQYEKVKMSIYLDVADQYYIDKVATAVRMPRETLVRELLLTMIGEAYDALGLAGHDEDEAEEVGVYERIFGIHKTES